MKKGKLNARFNDNISCEITFISLGLIVLECLQKAFVYYVVEMSVTSRIFVYGSYSRFCPERNLLFALNSSKESMQSLSHICCVLTTAARYNDNFITNYHLRY